MAPVWNEPDETICTPFVSMLHSSYLQANAAAGACETFAAAGP